MDRQEQKKRGVWFHISQITKAWDVLGQITRNNFFSMQNKDNI